MYSGVDFYNHFKFLWGSAQSGMFSTTKLNEFMKTAQVNYCEDLFDAYGLNTSVNNQAKAYFLSAIPTPTNNVLDASETSTDLPTFQRLIYIYCKFTVAGIDYFFPATELADDEVVNVIIQGSVMYPKYEFKNGTLNIYPENVQCIATDVKYFRTPFPIDTADATANLPFTKKNFEGIVAECLKVASKSNREPEYYQETSTEIRQNAPA